MQRLFNVFVDDFLLIDLAISLIGLSFICTLTYAMRWLPGKAIGHGNSLTEIGTITFAPDPAEMKRLNVVQSSSPPETEEEKDAVAAFD